VSHDSQRHGARAALLAVFCVAAGALVFAAPAGAHAFLKRSEPAAGSVVTVAPRAVKLFFNEPVKPAPGITVVRGGGRSVVAGEPYVPAGNPQEIVIPLRSGLAAGPYAVRWSELDEEDGHVIAGAFIFAVRSGLPPAAAAAPTTGGGGGGPPARSVVSRWLLFAGLLAAAGAAGFSILVSRPVLSSLAPELRAARRRGESLVLAAALAVATLGAALSVVLEPGTAETSFGRRMVIGGCVAAAGAAAGLASVFFAPLLAAAAAIAIVLLGLPTATGHASAGGVPHALSIPADLAHLAAAAFWIGGVLELAVVAPLVLARLDPDRRSSLRRALARRFAPYAAGAVVLLGASGIVRATNELDAVDQLWDTGYGRALLVKTAILVGLLGLGSLNRRRLRRVGIGGELVLLAAVIAAVAVLVNVQPGIARSAAVAAAPTSQTVVLAGQDDNLAVGVALAPAGDDAVELRATVLGFDGPVGGLDVAFAVDGRRAPATACGAGCYRATVPLDGTPRLVTSRIAGRGRPPATLRFTAPARWPAPGADEIVRRAGQTISSLDTLVVHSRLGSDAEHEVTTIYRMAAPNRLAYHNVGGGDSIIIGGRRWDRQAGGRWVPSLQDPQLRQPAPFWPDNVTNAHVLRTARVDGRPVWVVTFADPSTPAWFTAWVDRESYRTLRLDMVATAHFMHDRAGPFNEPLTIEPPGS
jgi:copper transport protein